MMKFRLLNDLHNDNSKYEIPAHTDDKDTVLLVAGDIHEKAATGLYLAELTNRFKHVVAVLGNHDYWGLSLQETHVRNREVVIEQTGAWPANLHILDNSVVEFDGYVVLGSTLWVDFKDHDPVVMWEAKHGQYPSRDYKRIKYGSVRYKIAYRGLRPSDLYHQHIKSVKWLDTMLET